jgi:transcriptional antiterminator RfaH
MTLWYVIRSKPNKDLLLFKQLQAHGIETYFPQLSVNRINPRASKTQPYFPGYLFVKLDVRETGFSLLQWMPYSLGLLYFGGDAASVSDELIRKIQKELANQGVNRLLPADVHHGDQVVIEKGPFAGYKAIFDTKIGGTERVRVLLLLLQKRQLAIELPGRHLHLQRA